MFDSRNLAAWPGGGRRARPLSTALKRQREHECDLAAPSAPCSTTSTSCPAPSTIAARYCAAPYIRERIHDG